MVSQEQGYVFVSSRPDGYITGYGVAVVALEIPEHLLELDDEFQDGESHYRVEAGQIEPGWILADTKENTHMPKPKVSKFKRHHSGYVLVVRHPDEANDYTVDGDVHTITLDLGSSFMRTPDTSEQAVSWAQNLPDWLDTVPITSPVYRATLDVVRATVKEYPAALAQVSRYQSRREI
jgi:hypothetical protein